MPSAAELACKLFDAAHAHGWKPPSNATACWSFYPTKNLGAFGDSGAVTTNDPDLAAIMRKLTGRDDQFHDDRQITSRMDEIQAAILRVKLKHLDDWLGERQSLATLYMKWLPKQIRSVSKAGDLYHLFVIRTGSRDELRFYLASHGVETKIHFPKPLHLHSTAWTLHNTRLPEAEAWCESVLSLPCFPGLTETEVRQVCAIVAEWSQRKAALNQRQPISSSC